MLNVDFEVRLYYSYLSREAVDLRSIRIPLSHPRQDDLLKELGTPYNILRDFLNLFMVNVQQFFFLIYLILILTEDCYIFKFSTSRKEEFRKNQFCDGDL